MVTWPTWPLEVRKKDGTSDESHGNPVSCIRWNWHGSDSESTDVGKNGN